MFATDTELTGSMRLRLWVATDLGHDMDLFVQVDKLDRSGVPVPFVAMSMIDEWTVSVGLAARESSGARHRAQLL